MTEDNRPLSPHLQIYRPQITTVLSIAHRISGVALVGGAALTMWWLWAVVSGINTYAQFYKFGVSRLGQLCLFLFLWALVYHTLNGVRHLFWDAGHGFEMKTVNRSGWTVVLGSMLLTVFYWIIRLHI